MKYRHEGISVTLLNGEKVSETSSPKQLEKNWEEQMNMLEEHRMIPFICKLRL